VGILGLWLSHGISLLEGDAVSLTHLDAPRTLRILLQAYLTTGLFITAHDAMHRAVTPIRWLNDGIGALACFLFAGMSYRRLVRNHALHHATPADVGDPDYYPSRNFFLWFGSFMVRYTTFSQLVVMAALFNLLKLRYSESALWAFWIIPALLASLQLFFFGTYLPHRAPHTQAMGPHRARSFPRWDLGALLTCYFFGYHAEHHENPSLPWFQLPSAKAAKARNSSKNSPPTNGRSKADAGPSATP
jgi:beta-carotene ketolase (CrtW type)